MCEYMSVYICKHECSCVHARVSECKSICACMCVYTCEFMNVFSRMCVYMSNYMTAFMCVCWELGWREAKDEEAMTGELEMELFEVADSCL